MKIDTKQSQIITIFVFGKTEKERELSQKWDIWELNLDGDYVMTIILSSIHIH